MVNRTLFLEPFIVFYLNQYVRPGQKILDVGCGSAKYRHSTSATYIGLDITDEPYSVEIPRDVDIVASATNIPLPDKSIDLVFSASTFYGISEPANALIEFHRVLKPHGRVILFDYNRRMQRRLELLEGRQLPCWTQWKLKTLLVRAGFINCELLTTRMLPHNRLERWGRLVWQEFYGQWIVVTGLKP